MDITRRLILLMQALYNLTLEMNSYFEQFLPLQILHKIEHE